MKPIKIALVIDDDAVSVLLTKRVLSSVGIIGKQVSTAHNGEEGLAHIIEAAAQGRLPQLVLLDIHMPVMDGFELLEELANQKVNLTGTRIVLLSSSQSPWDRERAAKSPAAAFLTKPLTKESLRGVME